MIDLMPALRTEVAAIAGVSTVVSANPTGTGVRVRVNEPAPGDASTPFRAFVVLVNLGVQRMRRLPVADWRVSAKFYGRTAAEAQSLYSAASDGIHDAGPRVNASRIAIYNSADESSAGFEVDPDTGQPYVEGIISLLAPTVALP